MLNDKIYTQVIAHLLPVELSAGFDLTGIEEVGGKVHIRLEEKSIPPSGYADGSLQPNGFYEESEIEDFPLRAKKVLLHVKRRRRIDKSTHKSVGKDWRLVAHGTRYSVEFAAFLKGIVGYGSRNSAVAGTHIPR